MLVELAVRHQRNRDLNPAIWKRRMDVGGGFRTPPPARGVNDGD